MVDISAVENAVVQLRVILVIFHHPDASVEVPGAVEGVRVRFQKAALIPRAQGAYRQDGEASAGGTEGGKPRAGRRHGTPLAELRQGLTRPPDG